MTVLKNVRYIKRSKKNYNHSAKIQKRVQKKLIGKIKKVDGPKKCTLYKEAKKKIITIPQKYKNGFKKILM